MHAPAQWLMWHLGSRVHWYLDTTACPKPLLTPHALPPPSQLHSSLRSRVWTAWCCKAAGRPRAWLCALPSPA